MNTYLMDMVLNVNPFQVIEVVFVYWIISWILS